MCFELPSCSDAVGLPAGIQPWGQAAEVGQYQGAEGQFLISPSYSQPKRVPAILLGICDTFLMWVSLPQAISCSFHWGALIFLSECFRCPLPFSRFQPGEITPRAQTFPNSARLKGLSADFLHILLASFHPLKTFCL